MMYTLGGYDDPGIGRLLRWYAAAIVMAIGYGYYLLRLHRLFGVRSLVRKARFQLHPSGGVDSRWLEVETIRVCGLLRERYPKHFGGLGLGNPGVVIQAQGRDAYQVSVSKSGGVFHRPAVKVRLTSSQGKRFIEVGRMSTRHEAFLVSFAPIASVIIGVWPMFALFFPVAILYWLTDIRGFPYLLGVGLSNAMIESAEPNKTMQWPIGDHDNTPLA